VKLPNSLDHNCPDGHTGVNKPIKGLQICKVTGQRVKITIHVCSTKAIIAQGNNARSLFKTAH